MFRQISAGILLKAVVGALAAVLVTLIGVRVWTAWTAYQNSVAILEVTQASEDAFKAMIAIRSDRSSTVRTWRADGPVTPAVEDYMRPLQAQEMNALRALLPRLANMPFPDRQALLPTLKRTEERLTALQQEFWSGVAKSRSLRRPALADEYLAEGLALQSELENISIRIFASVRNSDPFVDQMLDVKALAWLARDRAGEASLLISQGLAAGKLPPEARGKYDTFSGGAVAAWSAIDNMLATVTVPPSFSTAIADAKRVFFAPDYFATRERLLAALLAGEPGEMTADQWSPYTVPKLGAMQDVASGALDQAEQHALAARAAAVQRLAVDGLLLVGALAFAIAGALAINRRVTAPLHNIRDAMLALAGGDLTVEAPFADRKDEIGALASAFGTFRNQAIEKVRIEAEQETRRAQQASRQQEIEKHIQAFRTDAGSALAAFSGASAQMGQASAEMTAIAERTSTQIGDAAMAAEDASGNVAGIAAATEQLNASIVEISRQVGRASEITERAVEETGHTDDTVRGLSEAAEKIGEVVQLISTIAAQTNLLTFNLARTLKLLEELL